MSTLFALSSIVVCTLVAAAVLSYPSTLVIVIGLVVFYIMGFLVSEIVGVLSRQQDEDPQHSYSSTGDDYHFFD